jgi:hypothetical protein
MAGCGKWKIIAVIESATPSGNLSTWRHEPKNRQKKTRQGAGSKTVISLMRRYSRSPT